MKDDNATASTGRAVRLHRVLRATPEKVFEAFVTPAAMARWLPPRGYVASVHSMDARAGGSWRMSFTDFASGHSHAFGGVYLEFEPGKKLRYSAQFDDAGLPGVMETTVDLKKVDCGTEISIVQDGIPEVIPLDGCYLGWQDSLTFLAWLIEG